MSDRIPSRDHSTTDAESLWLDVLAEEQRQSWESGERLSAESYLARYERLQQSPEALLDVIYAEVCLREQCGEHPEVDEYIRRFPQFAEELRTLFEVHRALDSREMVGLAPQQTNLSLSPVMEDFSQPAPVTTPAHDSDDAAAHDKRYGPITPPLVPMKLEEQETLEQIGRYRIERLLGRGGFGTVYLARDDELQRLVAVKIPRRERFRRPRDAERFIDEARHCAQLKHPGLVAVHDIGRLSDGTCFVVMEYIDGRPLSALIARGSVPFAKAADIVASVAEAIHVAHKNGIVHRDLKPGNILIDAQGLPHVTDFGIAFNEQQAESGSPQELAGTPEYMSPEQLQAGTEKVDARSDIWSLGVILFELLTESRPFTGSWRQLVREIVRGEAPSPRARRPEVPAALDAICRRCLSKSKRERYATAQKLSEELRSWIANGPSTAVIGDEPESLSEALEGLTHEDLTTTRTFAELPIERSRPHWQRKAVAAGVLLLIAVASYFVISGLPSLRDRDRLALSPSSPQSIESRTIEPTRLQRRANDREFRDLVAQADGLFGEDWVFVAKLPFEQWDALQSKLLDIPLKKLRPFGNTDGMHIAALWRDDGSPIGKVELQLTADEWKQRQTTGEQAGASWLDVYRYQVRGSELKVDEKLPVLDERFAVISLTRDQLRAESAPVRWRRMREDSTDWLRQFVEHREQPLSVQKWKDSLQGREIGVLVVPSRVEFRWRADSTLVNSSPLAGEWICSDITMQTVPLPHGDLHEQLFEAQLAMLAQPEERSGWLAGTKLLLALRQPQECIALASDGLKQWPDFVELHAWRAIAQAKLRNAPLALSDLDEVRESRDRSLKLFTEVVVESLMNRRRDVLETLMNEARRIHRDGELQWRTAAACALVAEDVMSARDRDEYSRAALTFLEAALVSGVSNPEAILTDGQFAILRGHPTFQEHLARWQLERRYHAVWVEGRQADSTFIRGVSPSLHRTESEKLSKSGWYPISITASSDPRGSILLASVWRRREAR